MSINISLAQVRSALPVYGFPTRVAGSDQTTGMILTPPSSGTVLIPVESLLVLDLQNGGIVIQDGQDDFVHVLSKTQVDFLLLL